MSARHAGRATPPDVNSAPEGPRSASANESVTVALHVNGAEQQVSVTPRTLLSDALREQLRLTSVHVGCEQGVCGSCTIFVDGTPQRACLIFAIQMEGHELRTVEAHGRDPEDLDPVQKAFWDHHGLQCGFCTPGMLVSTWDLLRRYDKPSADEIRHELAGNLCRCTGYVNIVRAVQAAAGQSEEVDHD